MPETPQDASRQLEPRRKVAEIQRRRSIIQRLQSKGYYRERELIAGLKQEGFTVSRHTLMRDVKVLDEEGWRDFQESRRGMRVMLLNRSIEMHRDIQQSLETLRVIDEENNELIEKWRRDADSARAAGEPQPLRPKLLTTHARDKAALIRTDLEILQRIAELTGASIELPMPVEPVKDLAYYGKMAREDPERFLKENARLREGHDGVIARLIEHQRRTGRGTGDAT